MDIYDKKKRSEIMSLVRAGNTQPELIVRRALHRSGLRFRLRPKRLPGRPDIVLRSFETALFVNGCFWHHHRGCPKSRLPQTRAEFWSKKISDNVKRDRFVISSLRRNGWHVLTIWECQVRNPLQLLKLIRTIKNNRKSAVRE